LPALLCCLLLCSPELRADEYYVETEGLPERAQAQELSAAAEQGGLPVELVRRFKRGSGWQFHLRVEALADKELARQAASSLSEATGLRVRAYLRAGKDVLPLEVEAADEIPSGGSPPTGEVPAEEVALHDPIAGVALFTSVVRAHGAGAECGVDELAAQAVHFRYERRIPLDDEIYGVWHDYWRQGEWQRLEVRIFEGVGRDSLTVAGPAGAWLRVDGAVHDVEIGPAQEALADFAPLVMLRSALRLSELRPGEAVFQVKPTGLRDPQLLGLLLEGEDDEGDLLLGIDETEHRVRELVATLGEESSTWRYSDYQELRSGLIVPRQVELWRGDALRERISVLELEFSEEIDAELFQRPVEASTLEAGGEPGGEPGGDVP